jgi:hypothetical protein
MASKKIRRQVRKATTFGQIADALFTGLRSCYEFPGYGNNLSAFAIYDYNPKTKLMAVRITLSAAAHVCQAEAPTIQLGLRIKPLFLFQFQLEEQLKSGNGLLMKQVGKPQARSGPWPVARKAKLDPAPRLESSFGFFRYC